MGRFADKVAAFAKKTQTKADTTLIRIGSLVLEELVSVSPVGDPSRWKSPPAPDYVPGHFKGNWQVGLNSQPTGEVEGTDAQGDATVGRGIAVLGRARVGDVVHFVNNVPYARRIEYGWSDQAPAGVVRLTAARFREIVRKAGGEIRSSS